jgi:tRNA(fMet)-specific endonuclease VapC
VAELLVGVALAEGRKRSQRQTFVDDIAATLQVLTYDLDVAAAHAELLVAVRRQGLPRGAHDLIIAATARASGRTVLTSDATAFEDLPDVPVRARGRQRRRRGVSTDATGRWSDVLRRSRPD